MRPYPDSRIESLLLKLLSSTHFTAGILVGDNPPDLWRHCCVRDKTCVKCQNMEDAKTWRLGFLVVLVKFGLEWGGDSLSTCVGFGGMPGFVAGCCQWIVHTKKKKPLSQTMKPCHLPFKCSFYRTRSVVRETAEMPDIWVQETE